MVIIEYHYLFLISKILIKVFVIIFKDIIVVQIVVLIFIRIQGHYFAVFVKVLDIEAFVWCVLRLVPLALFILLETGTLIIPLLHLFTVDLMLASRSVYVLHLNADLSLFGGVSLL